MRILLAWIAAVVFVVQACYPDPLPFAEEVISLLIAFGADRRKIAGIAAILGHVASIFFVGCPPFGRSLVESTLVLRTAPASRL